MGSLSWRQRRRTAVLAAALLLGPSATWAQRWFIEPSVGARVVATTNTFLGGAAAERDIILGIRPQLIIRGDTPRLHVVGEIGVDSVNYTRGTLQNVLLPEADLLVRLTAVERVFFIEGGVRSLQTGVDPFGVRPGDTTTTQNTVTSTQYRISPYIDSEPVRGLHLRARSDNLKTTENGAALSLSQSVGRAYFGHHTASIEQDPRPFGWRLEADRSTTRFQGESEPLTIDTARAIVNYAINDSLSFGLRGGAERNNFFFLDDTSGSIYGAQMQWRPSERTALNIDAERRFFGDSWHLSFTHRSPLIAWNLAFSRDIDTTPEALFDLPATNNVAALLDSILTTRFPNPIDRAKQVQDLINQRGLPSSISTAISIIAPRLSISNTASASAALLGRSFTLAMSVFRSELRDALDSGPLLLGTAATNNRQVGAALAYSRRVSPTINVSAVLDFSKIDALDEVGGGSTKQATARAEIGLRLNVKSTAQFGVQYRRLASTVVNSGNESLAFVSLNHAF